MTEGLLTELLKLGTATLYEASGLDCDLPHGIRPAWRGAAVAGTAFPVLAAPADNLALHLALEQAEAGDVLVVAAGGVAAGYWGDVMTEAARGRGIAGLVIDGGVRDVDSMEAVGFPVFSRWISVSRTGKSMSGSMGTSVTIGRVEVRRGDFVVGDTDGVIAVPAAELERTVAAARDRAAREESYRRRLAAGESTMDFLSLRRPQAGS